MYVCMYACVRARVHVWSRCNTNYRSIIVLDFACTESPSLLILRSTWPFEPHIDGQYGVGTVTNWGIRGWLSCCGDRDRECPLWRQALVATKWFMGSSREGCFLRNIGKQSILLNISCTHDHVVNGRDMYMIPIHRIICTYHRRISYKQHHKNLTDNRFLYTANISLM